MKKRFSSFDGRLLALEVIARGEDGQNGMKAQLTCLCERFDQFEKKAIRWIAVGTSLPVVVKFLGRV